MNRLQHRETIEDFIRPLNGYRGKLEAQGKTPKDHIKENRMKLRQTAQNFADLHQKQKAPEKPAENFKLKKF